MQVKAYYIAAGQSGVVDSPDGRAAMPLSSPPTSGSSAGTELRLANGVTLLGKFDGEFAAQSQLRCRHECCRDGSACVCERRNFMFPDSLSHAHAIA